MKARDVMTRDVISVAPEASVSEAASALLGHGISAVPVVSASGELVGVVSEDDLMRREEAGTARRRLWWLQLLTTNETLAAEFTKSHARKVRDVMTQRVITAKPDTPLAKVADLLVKNGIKRVPIIDEGRVIGIVSRADLLGAVASDPVRVAGSADDKAIRDKVMARMKAEPWAQTMLVSVTVQNGTVKLSGFVDSEAQRTAMRVAAEVTPGVRMVDNDLAIRPRM